MPYLDIQMATSQQQKYKDLAQRLRDAGRGDLQRRLTKAIRAEGDAALRATQSAWRGVRVTPAGRSGKTTGLRARTAAATRIKVLASGIRIETVGAQIDPTYGESLSKGLDGLGRWRHPVYGTRAVWVAQKGQEVFYSTISGFERQWRAGIAKAMDDTVRQIEG